MHPLIQVNIPICYTFHLVTGSWLQCTLLHRRGEVCRSWVPATLPLLGLSTAKAAAEVSESCTDWVMAWGGKKCRQRGKNAWDWHPAGSTTGAGTVLMRISSWACVCLFTTIKNVFIGLPLYLWLRDASTNCYFLYFFILFHSTLMLTVKSGSVISLEILNNKVRKRIVFFLDARRNECLFLDTKHFSVGLYIFISYFIFYKQQVKFMKENNSILYRWIFWVSSWKCKELSWVFCVERYVHDAGTLKSLLSI